MRITLGSSSPFRQRILEDAGIPFEVVIPDIDEKAVGRDWEASHLVMVLSQLKSHAVLSKLSNIDEVELIITSDQVAVCDGEILEKPESKEQARAYLEKYAHFPVSTVTGVTLLQPGAMRGRATLSETFVDVAQLGFSPFSKTEIERLLENPLLYKACGAFVLGEPTMPEFDSHVNRMIGDMDSIIGLPLNAIRRRTTVLNI